MFKELSHKTFLVGGAIRNLHLNKEAKDYDYVIEDTSEEELLSVFPEAKKVGNDFPVYLINGHEVALARTEKSTGNGYTDFIFEAGVSIHEDLSRRDLTINSIAQNYKTGEYVDPHNGIQDIQNRVIRTINPNAFEDDPLRIYRAIRFAVEFDFNIEEETFELMKASKDKLKHMTMERVAIELEKVYQRSEKPSRFFQILLELDALKIHFKPLYVATKVTAGKVEYHHGNSVFQHLMNSLDYAKSKDYSFSVAMAGMMHDFGKIITPKEILPKHIGHEFRGEKLHKVFLKQHRFDSYTQGLIILTGKMHMRMHLITQMRTVKLVKFFREIPKKYFEDFIKATDTDKQLTVEQLKIISIIRNVLSSTKIEIPKHIDVKNVEAIKNYVHQQFVLAHNKNANS